MTRPVALVTGASAGIGAAFARALAADGHDLVLVARRAEALEALARELGDRHPCRAEVVPMDLAAEGAASRLATEVAARGMAVDLLINNAGFGLYGPFAEADPARVAQMLALNVVALTALTQAFLAPMRARGRGAIINVASVAGFQGVPGFSAYAASKAYVIAFSEGLAEEVRPDGIRVQALCPGTTATEFFDVAGMPEGGRSRFMSPEAVVEASLRGQARGRVIVVPGRENQLAAHGGRLLPRGLLTRLAGRLAAAESPRP
jgi:short-subunit dehydrogenase